MAHRSPECPPASSKSTVLSRRDIQDLIAKGRKIIIVDNDVLKVDAWLNYHPGGDKAILHMVGRDATDEVNAYACVTPTVDVCTDTLVAFIHFKLGRS